MGTAVQGRHVRSRWTLPFFAFFASIVYIMAMAVNPPTAAFAVEIAAAAANAGPVQSVDVAGEYTNDVARDSFTVTKIEPPKPPKPARPVAPAAGVPDPGTAKAIAYDMVSARGWGAGEFDCLVALWNKESGWNVYAHNRSSGAYGIPQSLPGSKMATAGADWETNPATQIAWGLGYIQARYGTPCGAWASSQARGWY